jgi:hypothetical protein
MRYINLNTQASLFFDVVKVARIEALSFQIYDGSISSTKYELINFW